MHAAAIPKVYAERRRERLPLLFLAALACCLMMAAAPLRAAGLAAQQGPPALAESVPAPQGNGELEQTASLFLTLLKAVAALALVLGLIALTTLGLKRLGWGKDAPGREGSLIQVLDTRMLAPKKYVAVLRIAGEFVALGITDQQINLLARLEPGEDLTARLTARQAAAPPLGPFAALLARARKSGAHDDSSPS